MKRKERSGKDRDQRAEKWRELEEMFQLEEKVSEKQEGEQEKKDVLLSSAVQTRPPGPTGLVKALKTASLCIP